MIKRAKVHELRVGMFVHDFNCEWHPDILHIEKGLIKAECIKDILASWGIREVYIDTERGLDIKKDTLRQEVPDDGVDLAHPQFVSESYTRGLEIPLAQEMPAARNIVCDSVRYMQCIGDQITKGIQPDVGKAYDITHRMLKSINRNRDALLLLTRIRNKDEYTLYHSISVSSLVLRMCQYLQLPGHQSLDLAIGALFHDIGKTMVVEKILKKPGRLTPEEYREIKRHTEYSIDLLQKARELPMECYDIALHHHEKIDGSGYPEGLSGKLISQGSQLTGICDMFDAITSERCYKNGVNTITGLTDIYNTAGTFFDQDLAHDFVRCLGVYPVGACVVLDDGRGGVVVEATENSMQPVVNIFFNEKELSLIEPQQIDLLRAKRSIVSYGDLEKYGFTERQVLEKMMLS